MDLDWIGRPGYIPFFVKTGARNGISYDGWIGAYGRLSIEIRVFCCISSLQHRDRVGLSESHKRA